ncbi:MAG: ribosome recycling factor [Caldicoprobacter oshimai]|uniref:Ribosome-recycling factor n=1 Tax=Caldicoprobacter faecalis TaxID=937334 RepID=A0A1I5RPV9_9FIRM|nr:ribosome recycling factor [Caldicoprobacter faecalis]PZN10839.1 MAG: ribosome recycling factor [Caldicoprobacter oshimai]SFP60437.1 ribosome recycling factor [Caldicoprobacter faecalis]
MNPSIKDVHDQASSKMAKSVEVLKKELVGIRAGRANPKILERIVVDYYGVPTPINQLGNITAPEPRMLVISLWDTKMIPAVEKEILKSDLGVTPSNDGKVIRLIFPELTEERRKELVKLVRKYGEEAKIAVRSIRREANEQLKKMKKNAEISEDDLKSGEDMIQKLTDQYVKKIDEIVKEKEQEIMEV